MAIRADVRRLLQHVFVVAAAFLLPPVACALSPDLSLRQLYHTAWTAKDGAPTGVEALEQTQDGYLWIAAAAGLFRFDGVRFERIAAVRGVRLLSTNVMSLYAPPTGGLWVGYRFGGASLIKDGKVWNHGVDSGVPIASITHFAQDRSGTVWANAAGDLMRFAGSKWEKVDQTFGIPAYVKSLSVSRDGALWIVNGNDVMVLRPGQAAFENTGIRTGDDWTDFFEAPDGSLWATDSESGIHALYVANHAGRGARKWIAVRDAHGEMLRGALASRDGTLWMASSSGVHRLNDIAGLLDSRNAAGSPTDVFTDADGLSARYAGAFLEDREGNVWIGTTGGLDRFRESRLTPVHLPRASNGFALAAADADAMMVGIGEGGAFRVTRASSPQLQVTPRYVDAAYRGEDGVVWLGGRAMLWHSSGSPARPRWIPVSVPVDSAQPDYYPVQAIARDKSGRLWVSLVRAGVMRFAEGKWTKFSYPPALSLAAGEDGRIWASRATTSSTTSRSPG